MVGFVLPGKRKDDERRKRLSLALYWFLMAVVVAGMIFYVVNPLDFDFIPVLGWIDDVLVIAIGAWAMISLHEKIVDITFEERARRRMQRELERSGEPVGA